MFLGFMSLTHALIAAAGVCLILSTADPLVLGLAILGSQLPDLDTSTSLIGQVCFPVSHWIEERFPHRSITHSLLATVAIALISLPIGYFLGSWLTAIATGVLVLNLSSRGMTGFIRRGNRLLLIG